MSIRTFSLALFCLAAKAGKAQFQLFATKNKDTCTWKIKNVDTATYKLTSASLRFFHQTADIVFTPAISFPGGGKYQFSGTFTGSGSSGMSFHYKTVNILSLSGNLAPGDSAIICSTINAGGVKDTIMAAGFKLYYTYNSISKTADIFPEGGSSCPSEAIFVNAGSTGAGIKLGSFASQNLHSGVCETQLVAIVFDNSTLTRKPVSGLTPHCSSGRAWTTFGSPTDYQIYYTFDISTPNGCKGFDSLVQNMSAGDYVAITNTAIEPLSRYDSITSSLAKLGISFNNFNDTVGYITVVGKKGAAIKEAEMAYCQDPHGVCYVSIEQSLISGDLSAKMNDYADCYTSLIHVLDKAQPQSRSEYIAPRIKIFPNPSQNGWNLDGINGPYDFSIFDAQGKEIHKSYNVTSTFIDGSFLAPGVYIIRIGNKTTQISVSSLIIKT